jgi:putative endonuclease
MKYLYVIKSDQNGDLYVGITQDVETRLKDHQNGKNRYTKGLRPWNLVHVEEFEDWKEARKKEKYYKSGYGKEKLKELLAS